MEKRTVVNLSVSAISFALCGLLIGAQMLQNNGLKSQLNQVETEFANKSNQLVSIKNSGQSKITETEVSIQGIADTNVKDDTALANSFFEPAFNWSSGKQYDEMRQTYIDRLGAENSFVSGFLKENIKIEVSGPEVPNNDIDINRLKSEYHDIQLFPTSWKPNGDISYVGIISYYVSKQSDDTGDKKGFLKSKMIVEFNMVGVGDDRGVKDVVATNGSFE